MKNIYFILYVGYYFDVIIVKKVKYFGKKVYGLIAYIVEVLG